MDACAVTGAAMNEKDLAGYKTHQVLLDTSFVFVTDWPVGLRA